MDNDIACDNTGNIQTKLRAIDLFSGIGGISVALKEYINVIQYCEIDTFCNNILVERMRDGLLHKASIHGDIRTLHINDTLRPEIIIGGFPCQDVSSIGLQKGIVDGARSGLFYEILRLIDAHESINYIFLENVANIVNCGLVDVVKELVARGFNFQWITRSASQYGAPHVRSRWFCLACKKGCSLVLDETMTQEGIDWRPDWTHEPEFPRITFKPGVLVDESFDPNWIQRCQCLGNTVVPMVVRSAFEELAKMSTKWAHIRECFADYGNDVIEISYPFSDHGLVLDGKFYSLPRKSNDRIMHTIDINLIHNDKNVKYVHYPTPRRGLTHPSTLTDRSLRDLPTVLIHSTKSIEHIKEKLGENHEGLKRCQGIVIPNVRYIEWMMGFPKDWTRSATFTKGKSNTLHNVNDGSSGTSDNTSESEIVNQDGCNPSLPPPPKKKHNGMHMFMKENPGKDVREIAKLWKDLDLDKRNHYSKLAKTFCNQAI